MPCPFVRQFLLLTAAFLPLVVLAATAEDLTRLAPADAGLCLEINNLDQHIDGLLASPLLNHLEQLDFFRDLQTSNNLRKLLGIAQGLSAQTGRPVKEVRRQLFGQEMLLAVWPSLPMGDVLGRGLLIFESSDAELLQTLHRSLANAQAGAVPDMEIGERSHAGLPYVVRQVEHEGAAQTLCFAGLGRVAVVSGDERLLQQALELHAHGDDPAGSLAGEEAYRASRGRVDEALPFHWYVQPRRWDDLVQQGLSQLGDRQGLLGAAAWDAWRHTDYWLIGMTPGPQFRIETFLACRHGELAPPLNSFAAGMTGAGAFMERVPSDALLALASRNDLKLAHQWLRLAGLGARPVDAPDRADRRPEPSDPARQIQDIANGLFIGLELFEPLLAGLGPNLGGYLRAVGGDEPSAGQSAGARHIQWVFGVEASDESMAALPHLAQQLDQGLNSALRVLARLGVRPQQENVALPQVTQNEIDGVTVTALERSPALPAGIVAAYAIDNGYLVAGTSPQAVAAGTHVAAEQSLAQSARWKSLTAAGAPWGQQLFIDCGRFRNMAAEHRQELAQMVSLWRRLRPDTATRALDQLLWLIEPMQAVALTARVEDDGVTLRFAAELAEQPPGAAARAR